MEKIEHLSLANTSKKTQEKLGRHTLLKAQVGSTNNLELARGQLARKKQ